MKEHNGKHIEKKKQIGYPATQPGLDFMRYAEDIERKYMKEARRSRMLTNVLFLLLIILVILLIVVVMRK
ncbi:MAG: hypothetical protein D6698_08460 [Gammaproteobacteria bacterium]|nr:MAG: hypothetical protein D6698_08460 [Gammaproteobacteria bacterium]